MHQNIGPCTRVQPCLASTAGGERYSDGPPHDGRELESAEHRTLNPRGQGASPWRPTIFLAQGCKQWTAPCVSPGSRAGLTSGGPTSSEPRWPQGTHARRHDVRASISRCLRERRSSNLLGVASKISPSFNGLGQNATNVQIEVRFLAEGPAHCRRVVQVTTPHC